MISGFGQPNIAALRPQQGTAAAERAVAQNASPNKAAMDSAAKREKAMLQGKAMLQRGAQRNVAQAMMLVSPKKRA